VKLSIKSFKVPELFIEIPATATVGSLKVCISFCLEYVILFFEELLGTPKYSHVVLHINKSKPPNTKFNFLT